MSQDQHDATAATDGQSDGPELERVLVVRHRQHRFPARDRVVKVRYDEQEYEALAAAAARARLTPSGYLACSGLAAAGQGPAVRWPSTCAGDLPPHWPGGIAMAESTKDSGLALDTRYLADDPRTAGAVFRELRPTEGDSPEQRGCTFTLTPLP